MENTIEYCIGRISAFAEIEELLSYVYTSDKNTATQLKILTQHIKKQIELDDHRINCELELMEGRELLRR